MEGPDAELVTTLATIPTVFAFTFAVTATLGARPRARGTDGRSG